MKKDIKEYIFFNKKESMKESIIKDSFSMATQLFCIWVAYLGQSTFWVFISGILFLFFIMVKGMEIYKEKTNTFDTIEDLEEWLKTLKNK